MKTARFDDIREKRIEEAFSKRKITKIWREVVKNQLRSSDINDLFDHFDFNHKINERADSLSAEILGGAYKASSPLIYKVEKKMGICRHMVLPSPTDALIMQVITEELYPKIKSNQPSEKAYYSRDRHRMIKPHESIDDIYTANWLVLWKKRQEEVYKFKETKSIIVVTDLANYYDSIDLPLLRESVLSMVEYKDEVLVDILFRVIDEVSWKPDYLPPRKRGLPLINYESIRLLGHSFLFEIDEVIKTKTNENFTRWMDDITFNTEDKLEARKLINSISDVLKSKGLALNEAKTYFLNHDQHQLHYLIDLNQSLDLVKNDDGFMFGEDVVVKMFLDHLEDRSSSAWLSVTKRFIKVFKDRGYDVSTHLKQLYIDYSGLRNSIALYFEEIGHGNDLEKIVKEIIEESEFQDDISLFYLCRTITSWVMPDNDNTVSYLKKICSLINFSNKPFNFYCVLWLKAKYDHPKELLAFIVKFEGMWSKNSFLRRQVACVLSRLYCTDTKMVKKILEEQIRSGVPDAMSVSGDILSFAKIDSLDKSLKFYLFPTNLKKYKLERFLVLCSVLNSDTMSSDKSIQKKVKEKIQDPFFKKWLYYNYNI